jgi:hypothetical protein
MGVRSRCNTRATPVGSGDGGDISVVEVDRLVAGAHERDGETCKHILAGSFML